MLIGLFVAEGRVWSWGRSENGRLGHGSGNQEAHGRPALIEALAQTQIAVIGAGYHHSMALSTKSALYAWGSGWSGQLGTGETKDAALPTQVEVPSKGDKTGKLVRIAAGYNHSMALTDGGRIYSWGTGDCGQLGHGPQSKRCLTPTLVVAAAAERFVSIAASENHSVALTDDGRVYSWGYNRWKQLGHEHTTSEKTHIPQAVASPILFSRITAGSAHTLAISRDHQLYYWGRMVLKSNCVASPQPLEACAGVAFADVSSRVNHCLALTKSGELWSFGYNEFGQCGLGHSSPVLTPTASTLLSGLKFSSIVAGGNHSLVLAQHESLQSGYIPNSPSSSSEDLKKGLIIRVELGNDTKRGEMSPTSPRGRQTRFSISKPSSSNITEQLASLNKKEQELRAERESLRAQQRTLDEAVAEWTRKDDELAAERTRVLKEAGLI